MTVLTPHLALTVTDVERAIPFHEALFGTRREVVRDGDAKWPGTEPTLNVTLNRGGRETLGAFHHGGIRFASNAGSCGCGFAARGAADACCAS